MTVEATVEAAEVTQDTGQKTEQQQPEVDTYEEQATALGWNKNYEGPGKVDAKEFVLRAPLFEKIKHQSKKLKDQEKALHDLSAHVQKVGDIAYKKAIADLKKERREAIEEADPVRVEALDEQIREVEKAAPVADAQPQVDPAIEAWVGKDENKWFHSDKTMKVFAIATHDQLLRENPTMDMEDSLKEVTKLVKKAFPDKFENPARKAAPVVESGSTDSGGGKKVFTFRDLSDEQKEIAKRFERQKIMTKDAYVKQLADSGLIGG